MDLQVYYSKIREIEKSLAGASVLIVSNESPDGGRAGVRTEVPRRLAAKMVVDGAARLGSADEIREFESQKAETKRRADQRAAASRMQFTVIPASEARKRSTPAGAKDEE